MGSRLVWPYRSAVLLLLQAPGAADDRRQGGRGAGSLCEFREELILAVHEFGEAAFIALSGLVLMQKGQLGVIEDFEEFIRSEEHTSELQSLMRSSYAVFC